MKKRGFSLLLAILILTVQIPFTVPLLNVRAALRADVNAYSLVSSGSDIIYQVMPGGTVSFNSADFRAFFYAHCQNDMFRKVTFQSDNSLKASQGILYCGYSTEDEIAFPRNMLDNTHFYDRSSLYGAYPLDSLLFVANRQAKVGVITLAFTARGDSETCHGQVRIAITDIAQESSAGDLIWHVKAGELLRFDRNDFRDFFRDRASADEKDAFLYLTFQPNASFNHTNGYLYYDFEGTHHKEFTTSMLQDASFFYSNSKYGSYPISGLTFLAANEAGGNLVQFPFTVFGRTESYSGTLDIQIDWAKSIDSAIIKYSYAFINDAKSFGYPIGYKIPLERFQLIYGQTALAKQKCEQAFMESQFWIGSCYGISATAGMFASSANGVTASAFRNGATRPGELQVSDVNAEWGLTLTQFIEAMQISQYSSMTAIASLQNKNRLSALISAVSAFENGGGGPVLICVYGPDRNGNYAGHALLAYHLDGQQLYVYDSNYPNDGNRAITISDDSWSYAISDGVIWNNSNGEITYIPYETYLSDWINRGHVQGTTYVSLVANVADATVRDSAGNEVAAFKKGKMVKGAEKAYPFTHIGITADGVSTAPPQVAVWLPVNDVYTVRNQDASKTRCKVSLCNVNQGVSVETTSATVKLSAEDSTSMNFATIEGIGCEYTITQMSGQDEVKFQGKTARDKVHALLENGVSSGSGITASTNISINGQTVSASDFMNGRTVSVSTVSPHFTDVSPGQYFYDPVMWAVGRGITNGTTATTFSPQNTCSRNHILTFLWRANGSPTAAIGNPFTDVNPDTTFGKAALWAAEKGLVSGTRFNGDNPCTRAEAVTYLWKLAGRPTAGRSAFTDVPSNADYAQAVSWAVERGVTKGTSETTFNPSGTCTRGQIVTFLYRAYAQT